MTTTTDNVAMGETGVEPGAGSPPVDAGEGATATEGGTSGDGAGDEKFVPYARFKEVIDQRNTDREELLRVKADQDQLLTWVHQKVVPAMDKLESGGGNVAAEEEYVDPMERQIQTQADEIKQLRAEIQKDRQSSHTKEFTKRIEVLCDKHSLASPAEIVDAYLKNGRSNFDFEAAAKVSHEKNLRKMDAHYKKRGETAKAKKLMSSTPASLAAESKPKTMKDAREMARAFFRNQQ